MVVLRFSNNLAGSLGVPGPQHFTDYVLLGWARSQASATDANWHALATLSARWSAPVFPLKEADFIKRGVEKGPAFGASCARPRKHGSQRVSNRAKRAGKIADASARPPDQK